MLKFLKGHHQPPTIINTERIKFIQCKKIGYPIQIFMNEGFNSVITEYMGGIVLEVDYDTKKYNSEIEVMEDFLNFLNGPKTETDEFGIYPTKVWVKRIKKWN